jgi:hypothetical protein
MNIFLINVIIIQILSRTIYAGCLYIIMISREKSQMSLKTPFYNEFPINISIMESHIKHHIFETQDTNR